MKILFATPRFPYPPLKGDQAVPYYRIRVLSERHEITLLSMYEADAELSGIKHLSTFCKEIRAVKLPKWQSMANIALRGPFSSLPFQVLYYQSSIFNTELRNLLQKTSFDVVHAFMLRLVPYLSGIATPKILELIDSMQLNMQRRTERESIPWCWIFQEELRRVTPFERHIGALFDEMVVVSERDRLLIPGDNISVVPLGVDSNVFRPDGMPKRQVPTLVFSGNLGYAPNLDAVKWFTEKCLARIQKEIPSAHLIIAGRNPPRQVVSLGLREGITVTGYIESMPAVLNTAHVAVAPMISGSGMQFKILEAMACGLPVVTTTLGLGSITARLSDEILVADDDKTFSEVVIQLLRNPLLSQTIGERARDFVIRKHSWAAAGAQIEGIYNRIVNRVSKNPTS